MFEIPTNSAKDLRPEVVDLVCQALFKKREMYWCDRIVYADGTFRADFDTNDGRQEYTISEEERDEAIGRFRDKGYHIFFAQWYAPNGRRLYSYRLHKTKRIDNGGGYYLF